MGRGRAKAKQTKVARALKYSGPQTDFERLQAELATGEHHEIDGAEEVEVDVPLVDRYADESDEDDEHDEDDTR